LWLCSEAGLAHHSDAKNAGEDQPAEVESYTTAASLTPSLDKREIGML
jgi:hypothetical protein